MICFNNFFKSTNFGFANLMWVFIWMIPLSLLYLIRPFFRIDHWHKSLTHVYFILQIIHYNIYKF
jgi:hypothetical protein